MHFSDKLAIGIISVGLALTTSSCFSCGYGAQRSPSAAAPVPSTSNPPTTATSAASDVISPRQQVN